MKRGILDCPQVYDLFINLASDMHTNVPSNTTEVWTYPLPSVISDKPLMRFCEAEMLNKKNVNPFLSEEDSVGSKPSDLGI